MAKKATKVPVKTEKKGAAIIPRERTAALSGALQELREEIDSAISKVARRLPSPSELARGLRDLELFRDIHLPFDLSRLRLKPRADVEEEEAAYELSLEIPGVEPADIEVTVSGDVLVVRAEKKAERKRRERNVYIMERSFGVFERAFQLPPDADGERVSATYKRGVLTIRVPKSKRSRKIKVKAA